MGAGFYPASVDMRVHVDAVSPNPSSSACQTGAVPEQAQEEQIGNDNHEAVTVRTVPDVTQPTQQERNDHNLLHIPYRSWCAHCCAGKNTERSFSATDGPGCLPCFSADYAFLGEESTDGTTPILVLKDDTQKSVFANVVPEKGANDFVVQQIVHDIELTGFTDVIFKTDNEPAMHNLQKAVKSARSHKTNLENSLRGQSKSNGFIENANRFVESQIRTMRSALNTNLQTVIDRNHIVMTWLIKYAATLITVFHIGKDGKTAYQRRKGKTMHPFLVQFCEKIMYKPLPDRDNKQNKLDARFVD